MVKITKHAVILIAALASCAFAADSVVGYYPSWMQSELPPQKLDMTRLTHVVHSFAWPTETGELQYDNNFLNFELEQVVHENSGFLLLALGGWGSSNGFAAMTADSTARQRFVRELLQFCVNNNYDGVDIDWEHPSNAQEKLGMNLLVRDLRAEFNKVMRPQPLFISMAVTAGNWAGQWLDYDELKKYVDWFGCMSYDFHGNWTPHSGHNSPLYASGGDGCGSVDSGIHYLTKTRGLPKEKVLLGVPFYGRDFSAVGLYKPKTGECTEHRYSEIPGLIQAGWTRYWDDTALVPYLMNGANNKFLSYDDTLSVRFKAEYAVEKELKGVMIWALGQDIVAGDQPLLRAVSAPILQQTGVAEKKTTTPADFALLAFPNPVNNQATIIFHLNSSCHAHLDVVDLRGRVAAQLFAGHLSAGEHRFSLNAQHLDSGIYFCRLKTSTDINIVKLTLLQ